MIALIVVLSSYVQIPLGAAIRLDLSYAVVMFVSLLFGGLYGGAVAFIARILNDFIFSGTVSIWWVIGSAAMAVIIGASQKLFLSKIKKRIVKRAATVTVTIAACAAGFIGIVPVLAHLMIGIEYSVILGYGVLAFISDAIVMVVLGYPLYLTLIKLSIVKALRPIEHYPGSS